jgi:hypothetical protein
MCVAQLATAKLPVEVRGGSLQTRGELDLRRRAEQALTCVMSGHEGAHVCSPPLWKLSAQITWWPFATWRSQRVEPRNLTPLVTAAASFRHASTSEADEKVSAWLSELRRTACFHSACLRRGPSQQAGA